MKLINKGLKGLVVLVLLAVACTPNQDFPGLQNTLPLKPKMLNGTWTVKSVTQYDREAIDDGFPKEVSQKDITTLFPFTQYKVTFNLQANGSPSTFSVNPGAAPNFLALTSGNWTLDHYVFATQISLFDPMSVTSSAFRIRILNDNDIKLQVVRNDAVDGTEYSFYEYELTK